MYEAFYGFSEDPFRISPDYRFSYPHRSYLKAKNYLEYGLLRAEGIVVITGEPGTGKSTVINDLLSEYDSNDLVVAKLLTTQIDSHDLLRMLAYSFGLDALSMDKATVLTYLERHLIQLFESGQRALLIVDEAQNLSIDSLEELRLLSNLQQYEQPLLQIFLIGQLKLRELIRNPLLEQLRQRLVAACHFEPLNSDETRHYIKHRLSVVGWQQDPCFTDEAFRHIHHYSGGIPRRINLICNRLLLHGHVESLHELGASDVQQVIAELPAEMTIADKPADTAAPPDIRRPPDSDVRQTPQQPQATETVRLYRHQKTEPTAPADPTMGPGVNKPTVASRPDPSKGGQTNTFGIPKKPILRQHTDTDPLLSLTPSPSLVTSSKGENQQDTATATRTVQRDKPPSRSFPSSPAMPPPARVNVKRRLYPRRSWMRPIAAGIIFVAAFGISYGYLRLNPGKYTYSTGVSFQSDESVSDPRNSANKIDTSDSDEDSESYVYAQKETSSDLLNLTLSSLLPGPENIQDMGISESIDNAPPSSSLAPDAESTLRNIQNQEHRNLVLQEQSTQIIEEVIGEGKKVENEQPSDPPQQQIGKTPREHHEKAATQTISHNLDSRDAGVESKSGRSIINRDLENALRHYTSMVRRLNNGSLKITLLSELSFQPNSENLKNDASTMLDKLAFVMRNYDGFLIQVVYQKSNGISAAPQAEALSRRRAETVASHLINNGIAPRRVKSEHYTGPSLGPANTGTGSNNSRSAEEIGIYLKPQT